MWFCFNASSHLPCLVCSNFDIFFVAGTFARVCLCRERNSRDYFALKILAIHDVIRLKQVEHVKNEKNILKVSWQTFNKEKTLIQPNNIFSCTISEDHSLPQQLHSYSWLNWTLSSSEKRNIIFEMNGKFIFRWKAVIICVKFRPLIREMCQRVPGPAQPEPSLQTWPVKREKESLLPFSFKGRFKSLHPSFDIEM